MMSLAGEKVTLENIEGPLATTSLSSSGSSLSGEIVALGIDTWSLCWYGEPGSPLLSALRSLATIQAGRAYLVPTRVEDHRVGWFPEYGLVFAEGHPDDSGLCSSFDLAVTTNRLLTALDHFGIPTLSASTAQLRRLDVAVDVSMPTPQTGLALLDRLGSFWFREGGDLSPSPPRSDRGLEEPSRSIASAYL
jgi:hypothetical protein